MRKTQEPEQLEAINDAVIEFSEAFHAIYDQGGMRKLDIAEAAGITPTYLSRIFSGQANPTLEAMALIAQTMGHRIQIRFAPEGEK